MSRLLVVCCFIAAAFLFGSSHATLCEDLVPRTIGGNGTAVDFASRWINASFALYATDYPFFGNASDEVRYAHELFYGR